MRRAVWRAHGQQLPDRLDLAHDRVRADHADPHGAAGAHQVGEGLDQRPVAPRRQPSHRSGRPHRHHVRERQHQLRGSGRELHGVGAGRTDLSAVLGPVGGADHDHGTCRRREHVDQGPFAGPTLGRPPGLPTLGGRLVDPCGRQLVVRRRRVVAAIRRNPSHRYTLPVMDPSVTEELASGPTPAEPSGAVAEPRTLVRVPGNHLMADLLGPRDEVLDQIETAFPNTAISVRGNEVTAVGADAPRVGRLFEELVLLLERGHRLGDAEVRRTIGMIKADERPSEVLTTEVLRTGRGGVVRPKTSGQKRYLDAIARHTVTFGIGPAGTGKSWLAVAMAVRALQRKEVERIVLTRPAVEAGERLGFLPGDLMAKVDPYLRPLYDALNDMVGSEGSQRLLERGVVEVAPLAFMRGRTLNGAFIILDEAQNTTPEQMKMFLTRVGFGSKVVVTGDLTQIDVQGGRSGLLDLERILSDVDDLTFVRLSGADVVRHKIVQDIVAAYERASESS